MAERVSPMPTTTVITTANHLDDGANYWYNDNPFPFKDQDDLFDKQNLALQFTLAQKKELDTYVIQIPKDQIYRVPPPENAKIVERYRNLPKEKKKRPRCTCTLLIVLLLVILGASIGLTLFILYKIHSPKGAIFSIVEVHVKNNTRPGYEITMKARNPNPKVGINYESSDGDVILSYKTHKLGSGKFPELQQEASESRKVHVTLAGISSAAALPEDVSKSMRDSKTDHQVSLELRMNLEVNMNLWILNLWSMDMNVVCDFKVSTLRAGTKILSQKCDTKTD